VVVAPPPPKPAPPRAPIVQNPPVEVADALPFVIVLAEDVPVDAPEGMGITFTVSEGLKIGDKTVIAKGATVTGSVTSETSKKGFLGRGSNKKPNFRLAQAEAVDGKKIAVRALPSRGDDGVTIRSLDTGKGSKPKGVAAVQGALFVAYVDGDQSVTVNK
jgi:hypothetical protein